VTGNPGKQYIAGDIFSKCWRQKGPFSQEEVLLWPINFATHRLFAHARPQIIHRDIKPQNLKMTARGAVVLLDFAWQKDRPANVVVTTSPASLL